MPPEPSAMTPKFNQLAIFRLPVLLAVAFILAPPAMAYEEDALLHLEVAEREVQVIDFKSVGRDGKPLRLSDFRGKVVFMNFWATWCIPCLAEMPAMERLHQRMRGKPFVILAISQGDSLEKINAYAKKHKLSFEMVLDLDAEIGTTYRADKLPLTYIISPDGLVLRRAVGPREWDSEEAVRLLERFMGDTPATPTPSAHSAN